MINVLLTGIVFFIMSFADVRMEIKDYLTQSQRAEVIVDGNVYAIDDMNLLNNYINNMLQDSHWMPAYSVSIHTETTAEMKYGVWLKLEYNGTQCAEEMNFDTLLIKIEPNFQGFNIIRGNKGIYEGRCYYINLNTDMSELYNYLSQYAIDMSHID